MKENSWWNSFKQDKHGIWWNDKGQFMSDSWRKLHTDFTDACVERMLNEFIEKSYEQEDKEKS